MATGSMSTLGLKVEASSVENAESALLALAKAGRAAVDTVREMGTASQQASKQVNEQVNSLRLQSQATATSSRESTKGIDAQVNALKLQASTFSMSAREAQLYALQMKGATATQLASADAVLKQIEAQKRAGGISAGQTANAKRMVAPQMTDIVTQLAGGQNPMLVMIQQGGQLKDMFGGIGPMFSALTGMITPMGLALTAAAAAVGVLGYALYEARAQNKAFNESLVMSGNSVGQTVASMRAMSEELGKTTGSQSGAAEALTQVAASGKIGSSSMKGVAEAAVLMERATGKAFKETVAEAVKLGEDPVKASMKLNESMHYLTASTFARIQALQQSGREDEAAALAQDTYSKAMKSRAEEVIGELGLLQTAWNDVKQAAKSAWDSMASGTAFGFSDKPLEALQAKVKAYADARAATGNTTPGKDEMQAQNDLYQQTFSAGSEARQAASAAKRAENDKASITALNQVNGLIDAGGSKAVKLARDLKKNNEQLLQLAGDKKLNLSPEVLADMRTKSESAIREKYKESKGPKGPSGQTPIERITDQINSDKDNFGKPEVEKKIDAMQRIVDPKGTGANAGLSKQLEGILRETQALSDAKVRAAFDEEKSLAKLKESQADVTATYQEEIDTQKALLDTRKISEAEYVDNVNALQLKQIDNLKATSDAEVAILKAGRDKVKTVTEQLQYDKRTEASLKGAADGIRAINKEAAKDDTARLKKTLEEIKQVTESMYTPLERYNEELKKLSRLHDGGMSDTTYQKAMKKAWNEYGDSVRAAGKSISTMEDLAANVASSIQENLGTATTAMVEGKWSEMGKSFEKTISSMLAKAIEANLSAAIFGDRAGKTGGGGLLDNLFGSSIGSGASKGGSSGGGGGFLSSIGSFIGSLFSFDGGGKTPDGPRSGGMDGKGGFMALLHPNETVIDHTKNQSTPGTGGGSVQVNMPISINVTGVPEGHTATAERKSNGNGGESIEIMIKRIARAAVAEDINTGGEVAESIQGVYGSSRASGAKT